MRYFFQIFANAVVHDDRVVERIADDRQQRRDAVQVELHLRHREQAKCQRHFVKQAAKRTDTELPLETYPDVDRNAEDREAEADRPGADQFARHLARNGFDRAGLRGREGFLNARHQLLPRALGGGLVAVGKRGADRHGLVRSELLDRRFAKADVADLLANFVHRRHRLGEFDADRLAADEIDTQVQALHRDQRDRHRHEEKAHEGGDFPPAQEVDIGVVRNEFQQAHRFAPLNVDRRRTRRAQPMGDEHTGNGNAVKRW